MAVTSNNAITYTEAELSAKTKAQLLEICAALGVNGMSNGNLKADIINALLAVM